MAQQWAQNSYAKRKKVGALIVKGDMIISDGYNGTPSGFDNVCEIWVDAKKEWVTKPQVLHAEANAITKLARSTISSEGSVLYTLVSPCFECSKLIIQSGISRVVYVEEYRKTEGVELLEKAGIQVDKIKL